MKERITVAKNTFFLVGSKIFSNLFIIVILALAARRFGLSDFGIYTLALTFGTFAGVFFDFGSSFLVIREVAQNKNITSTYFVNGSVARIVFTIFVCLILVFVIPFVYGINIAIVVFLGIVFSFFRRFTEFFCAFFNANEKMGYTAFITISEAVLIFLGSIAFLKHVDAITPATFLLVQITMGGIATFGTLYFAIKLLGIRKVTFDINLVRDFIKSAIPFGCFSMFAIVYLQSDTIMLSIMKGKEAVGYYQVAIRVVMAFELISALFSFALYPTLSRVFKESAKKAIKMIEISSRYILAFGLLVGIGLFLLSSYIIGFIFGSQYLPAISTLKILSLLAPLRFPAAIFGIGLFSTNRQRERIKIAGGSALLNITLNVILIPTYGINGAAVASVSAAACLLFFYYISILEIKRLNVRK